MSEDDEFYPRVFEKFSEVLIAGFMVYGKTQDAFILSRIDKHGGIEFAVYFEPPIKE